MTEAGEPSAFFLPRPEAEDVFLATAATIGPWSEALMHGGPPSALLGRGIERALDPAFRVARIHVELLRPLALGRLRLEARAMRAGRRVQRAEARLVTEDGKELARATATAIRREPVTLPTLAPAVLGEGAPPPDPESCAPYRFAFFPWEVGYHTAVDTRQIGGVFGSGAAAMWLRARVPLVLGEVTSPLAHVLVAADAGNGIAQALDASRWSFLPPELTVTLFREPVSAWIGLDGVTRLQPDGIGLADTRLLDERGEIGRVLQPLVVEPRSSSPA